jgi:ADP-heptose:LPS heptosyltransferase
MAGLKTAVIDKGRKEKKQLTAKKNKRLIPLKTSFQRYADVFNALGLNCTLNENLIPVKKRRWPGIALSPPSSAHKNICIAPFAKHREKTYPPEKMKAVIGALSKEKHCRVFLLGGKDEAAVLQSWEKEFPGVINIAGRFSFFDELSILSNMDLVISMDSANMHLASLFGVPVVSIWGATHPFAGFYGWSQDVANAVHIDLYCRPCSVFGNKPCYRGDHACMKNLEEERIVARTLEILS